MKKSAFAGIDCLVYIELPCSLTKIDANAFADCTNLYAINLGMNSPDSVDKSAFNGCVSLTETEGVSLSAAKEYKYKITKDMTGTVITSIKEEVLTKASQTSPFLQP